VRKLGAALVALGLGRVVAEAGLLVGLAAGDHVQQ
jgi:hypothetical protein